MQLLDHILQPHCIRPYHNIRKIRAEYRMAYARSCICRKDRTRLPSAEHWTNKNNEDFEQEFENTLKFNE